MNERERLIELIYKYTENLSARDLHEADFDEKFADYLLENGIVVSPCKVGDVVFEIIKDCFGCSHCNVGDVSLCERKPIGDLFEVDWDKNCIYEISETHFNYSMIDDIGETIFLTRYEAERALKGGNEDDLQQ